MDSLIKDDLIIILKEITDILEVRHDKAMIKVLELAKESSFGSMSKMDIQYFSGKNTIQTIETFALTKKQAIAVGARLNNKLLMNLIDRLEEAPLLSKEMLEQIEKFVPKKGFLEENKKGELKSQAVKGYYRVDKKSEYGILLNKQYRLTKLLGGFLDEEIEKDLLLVESQIQALS